MPQQRIVTTEKFDESWYPGEAVDTVTLTEQGGKTTMTTTVLYESKEARDGVLKSPMDKGVAASYDTLDGAGLEAVSVPTNAKEVLAWLQRVGTRRTVEGMARYCLPSDRAFGVPVGILQAQAKRIGKDHAMAAALWKSG